MGYSVTSCWNGTSSVGLVLSAVLWAQGREILRIVPMSGKLRTHLVVFGQGNLLLLEMGRNLRGQILQAFHFTDG